MSHAVPLPVGVLAMAERGPGWAAFVARLPRVADDLVEEWHLRVDGSPAHGHCSLVVPVDTGERPAMLKVGYVEEESEHEHLALRDWNGVAAVELLRADPRRGALLLERLGPGDLSERWDVEACEVVAGLYGRLHRPAGAAYRPLTRDVERWRDGLLRMPANAPAPRRLVQQAAGLAADLLSDPASTGTLIHADLHYANVLAARREPWLVIDPKPVSGDPHYEPAPMLTNRFDELAGRVRDGVRQRFHTLVDVAGLDEDRARDWVIVRMLCDVLWAVQDAHSTDRALTRVERDRVTRCLAVAKAVQD